MLLHSVLLLLLGRRWEGEVCSLATALRAGREHCS
jgi:hypothetical protein